MSAVEADHEQIRPDPPTTYYDDLVKVPGFGEPPERCRGLTPVGFCEAGHTVLGRSSCQTRYCPDHWWDWAEDAVISMVARMAAYRWTVDGAEARVSHVVASPPQERRYSEREMWETRSEAYDALDGAGVRGGPVITHPYRTSERANGLYETAVEAGGIDEDHGRWRFLRESADGWEDLSRYIEAAPHYHVPIAPAPDVDGGAAPDGWIVKRIRTMDPLYQLNDTEAYRDMVASAYYVLSHGAVEQGKQTTTWFGAVHPSAFNPSEELTSREWREIQKQAEKAVREDPGEEGDGGGVAHGPEECPVEDCNHAVHDLVYLPDFLEDEEWVEEVRAGRGGRERIARLRGAFAWWDTRTDRPPPSVQSSEERMRNWLEDQGMAFTPEVRQASLQTAIMASN